MKHRNPLLQWAAQWHYPFLRMPDGKHIRHGEAAWRRFIGERNQKRVLLAWGQIAKWNDRAGHQERSA